MLCGCMYNYFTVILLRIETALLFVLQNIGKAKSAFYIIYNFAEDLEAV